MTVIIIMQDLSRNRLKLSGIRAVRNSSLNITLLNFINILLLMGIGGKRVEVGEIIICFVLCYLMAKLAIHMSKVGYR